MNSRELVDHIRSGAAKLVLDKPLRFFRRTRLPRFFRRTRSNSCAFNEFLQALQSSETIRDIHCKSQHQLGISEDEWVLLVKTLGSIRDIQNLRLYCAPGSRNFHPFQAVADAVNSAHSLRKLVVDVFPREPSGLIALANALREHTSLREFTWFDLGSRREAAPRDLSLDPVLRALLACPHLRQVFIKTERP
jgi:hypothetical protein